MKRKSEFTLVEIIATLVLVGILSLMIFPFLGRTSSGSVLAAERLSESLKLNQVIEKITRDYLDNYTTDLFTLKDNVGSEGSTRNNSYGNYYVVHNRYVLFSSGTEADDSSSAMVLLKVTVRSTKTNEQLTTYFTYEF